MALVAHRPHVRAAPTALPLLCCGHAAGACGRCPCGSDPGLSACGGRTVRCARAVRKVGHFGPVSPDGQGGCNNYCVPRHRTAQILTQSKNSDDELKQSMLHTENAECLQPEVLGLRPSFWPRFNAI